MAGKELKATEKTVLKHSRDGVLEQNLADGSAKKVSNKAEEAVLKTARPDDERFDKLKAAGLVVELDKCTVQQKETALELLAVYLKSLKLPQ